jgi:hypothetical protein
MYWVAPLVAPEVILLAALSLMILQILLQIIDNSKC